MIDKIENKFLGDVIDCLMKLHCPGAVIHIVDDSDTRDVEIEEQNDEIPFCDSDVCPFDGDCSECPHEKACAEDLWGCEEECEDYDPPFYGIPDIDRVVFNEPATIVFWMDGTKTVVKCMKGEKFERYAGFAAACMKKMFGSTSRAKAVMDELAYDQIPVEKKQGNEQFDSDNYTVFDGVDIKQDDVYKVAQEAVNEALGR